VISFFIAFTTRLVDLLDLRPGARLLDVGSGRGAIAAAALAHCCTVTALDAAPRMVGLHRCAEGRTGRAVPQCAGSGPTFFC
jgi:cyclopropane fatty-acyl-phospholipid synthase-like methyltransferase